MSKCVELCQTLFVLLWTDLGGIAVLVVFVDLGMGLDCLAEIYSSFVSLVRDASIWFKRVVDEVDRARRHTLVNEALQAGLIVERFFWGFVLPMDVEQTLLAVVFGGTVGLH